MKTAAGLISLFVAVFFATVVLDFVPPLAVLHGARIVLIPMFFCYAALALPFPAMLAAAVLTGLFVDLSSLQVLDGGHVEIALGWSIFYFVIFGSFAQGFRQMFLDGHWWVYVLLSGVGTSLLLALQFLMITARRDSLVINELVAWRILAPGAVAILLAPLVHLVVALLSSLFPQYLSERDAY